MQTRRQEILTILKQQGEATVDELANTLDLTPVTVRHHLDILRADGLVEAPAVRRRHGPGRPQYVYTLTEASADHFPQGYDSLANELLSQIRTRLGAEGVKDVLTKIADDRIAKAPIIESHLPMEIRLETVVAYLSDRGFIASWEHRDDQWLVCASNCPCQHVAEEHPEICLMDKYILESLISTKVVSLQRIIDGAYTCVYQIQSVN